MTAVPLVPDVMSFTVTWPLWVRASAGSMRPIVVVKVMTVPFCTGVPPPDRVVVVVPVPVPVPVPAGAWPFSMTVAMMVTSLFSDTVDVAASSVMTLPVGASSGTLSHAATRARGSARSARRDLLCDTISAANDNSLMSLRGQARCESGYAMAALLVSLAVMAVLMSVAMPVWRHEAQREKEAELVFRGLQYVRAVRLFQQKTGTLPTSVDMLVQGNYLRKKYKDPITNDEFDYVGPAGAPGGQPGVGQPGQPGRGAAAGGAPARGGQTPAGGPASGRGPTGATGSGSMPGGMIPGGMMGVRSKSKDESIRIYAGRNHYNEWVFTYIGQQQQPGGPGRGQPGGVGGPGGRPGGPGGRPGGPGTGGPGGARGGPRGTPPPLPPGFPGGPGRGRQ
jgi:type II secretory pathway pseudopilin PulG